MLKCVLEVVVPIDKRQLQIVERSRALWTHRARCESDLKTLFMSKVATFRTDCER